MGGTRASWIHHKHEKLFSEGIFRRSSNRTFSLLILVFCSRPLKMPLYAPTLFLPAILLVAALLRTALAEDLPGLGQPCYGPDEISCADGSAVVCRKKDGSRPLYKVRTTTPAFKFHNPPPLSHSHIFCAFVVGRVRYLQEAPWHQRALLVRARPVWLGTNHWPTSRQARQAH